VPDTTDRQGLKGWDKIEDYRLVFVEDKHSVIHLRFENQGNSSQKLLRGRTLTVFHTLPFSNSHAPTLVRASKMADHNQKSKVIEMGSSRFYLLDETMVRLYVGPAMK
jgi:hypothetical protein